MMYLQLLNNINTALRKTVYLNETKTKIRKYCNLSESKSKIRKYCDLSESKIRNYYTYDAVSFYLFLQKCLAKRLSKITEKNKIIIIIQQFVVYNSITKCFSIIDPDVFIFDCLNYLKCKTVIGFQEKCLTNIENNYKTIHHIESQIVKYQKFKQINFINYNYTNQIYFMFGQVEINTKGLINKTEERANIWQCALQPFGLDWNDIIGPVCSYKCLINVILQKIKIKNMMYFDDYKHAIAMQYVHYISIKYSLLLFPEVLIKIISKYIPLFNIRVDTERYMYLKIRKYNSYSHSEYETDSSDSNDSNEEM